MIIPTMSNVALNLMVRPDNGKHERWLKNKNRVLKRKEKKL